MKTFLELKKNLKKDFPQNKKIRLAILADFSTQLLKIAVAGYGKEAGIDFDIYEPDYNQAERQVFDVSSELYRFEPQFVWLFFSGEHLLSQFQKTGPGEQAAFADIMAERMKSMVDTINGRLKTSIILNTFNEINDGVFGNFAAKVPSSFRYQQRKLNLRMMDLGAGVRNVFLLDLQSLQSEIGYRSVFDPKLYINGDLIFQLEFLPVIAKNLTDIIGAVSGSFKKCLILDLDNTVWGGIIGDDGMDGIQVGDLGIGKAFSALQAWAKQLRKRGVIICVCSKNTEEIAREPFESHPDMTLRLEDIAVFVANWENKVDNIRHIQRVLNIGFDSMVFLDDNPFEREMIRKGIPELTVPELPEDPAEYLTFIQGLNLFETASFTEEDEQRTTQYQEEARRQDFQKTFASEEEFLESLEMCSEPASFSSFSIPRVAQLTQRSNQFNLRTVRYTEEDIRRIADSPDHQTFSLDLTDKFGNHGLIAVVILEKLSAEKVFIDTWVMSCRVLKRGMEQFTLNAIVAACKAKGFSEIVGEYLPTRKNGLVRDHYKNLGFREADGRWSLSVADYTFPRTFINYKNNEV